MYTRVVGRTIHHPGIYTPCTPWVYHHLSAYSAGSVPCSVLADVQYDEALGSNPGIIRENEPLCAS